MTAPQIVITGDGETGQASVTETDTTSLLVDVEPAQEDEVFYIGGPRGPKGDQGNQGLQGIQGLPGADGANAENTSYHHSQVPASDTWVIPHNLGFIPAGIYVEDSANTVWDPYVVDNTATQTILQFYVAGEPVVMGGTADLS